MEPQHKQLLWFWVLKKKKTIDFGQRSVHNLCGIFRNARVADKQRFERLTWMFCFAVWVLFEFALANRTNWNNCTVTSMHRYLLMDDTILMAFWKHDFIVLIWVRRELQMKSANRNRGICNLVGQPRQPRQLLLEQKSFKFRAKIAILFFFSVVRLFRPYGCTYYELRYSNVPRNAWLTAGENIVYLLMLARCKCRTSEMKKFYNWFLSRNGNCANCSHAEVIIIAILCEFGCLVRMDDQAQAIYGRPWSNLTTMDFLRSYTYNKGLKFVACFEKKNGNKFEACGMRVVIKRNLLWNI